MEKYTLEKVTPEEVACCGQILESGRQFQRAQGFQQWTDNYPNAQDVAEDCRLGRGYTLKVDGQIAGYMCIDFEGEPAYDCIDGAWRREGPYAAVHRIAIGGEFRGRGLAEVAFRWIGELCLSRDVAIIRIDTHFPNTRMQHVLERSGFVKCGIVTYKPTVTRLAYEKLL